MKAYSKFILFLLIGLCFSCVKDIDFNQAEDFEINPAVPVSLVKFDLVQTDFYDENNFPITIFEDEVVFTALDNSTAQEDLRRVLLNFEVLNEFNRNFRLEILFVDEADVATYDPITLVVDANNQNYTYEEDIIVSSNPSFLNSRKIRVTLTVLASGGSIDPNTPRRLEFKSAGTFYFTID